MGIDLCPAGPTPNDSQDPDAGPNDLQNAPVIVAGPGAAGVSVSGTLNSRPNTTYRIDFYSSLGPNNAGRAEGRSWLGTIGVTTDAGGDAVFGAELSPAIGNLLTATATDPGGSTSEFSLSLVLPGHRIFLPLVLRP
jgi:hypothetical protein